MRAVKTKPRALPFSVAATVDALGVVKSEIASLEADEQRLRALLISAGPGSYNGDMYDASVAIAERNTLDMEAVRAKLSPQFIAAHTRTKTVDIVKVTARKGGGK